MKNVKLSAAQTLMIRLMQEGYELSTCGVTIGHTGWTNSVRLHQHNYPDGDDKSVRASIATVKALQKRGLIKNITNRAMDSLNVYALTQLSKEMDW